MEKGGSVCPCCDAYENMVAEDEMEVVRARLGSGTCRFSAWLPSKVGCTLDPVPVPRAGASSLLLSSSPGSSAGSFVRAGWFPGAAPEDGAGWCSASNSSGKSLAAFLAGGELQCCRCITPTHSAASKRAKVAGLGFPPPVTTARALMKRQCARLALSRLNRTQLDLL